MSQAAHLLGTGARAIQRQLTYRAATLAGLATNFFFGLLRAAVLVALYRVGRRWPG